MQLITFKNNSILKSCLISKYPKRNNYFIFKTKSREFFYFFVTLVLTDEATVEKKEIFVNFYIRFF